MEGDQMDANTGSAGASESSALASALDKASDSGETEAPKQETTKPLTTSAGTLKTETGEDKVPWHEDNRWKKWQEDKKSFEEQKTTLQQKAMVADQWNAALQNPKFAKEVLGVIEKLTAGEVVAPPEEGPSDLDKVAEKLLGTKVFKQLLGKFDHIEGALGVTTEKLVASDFDKMLGGYQADFNSQMKDFEVDPEFRNDFEKIVWDNLYREAPDSVKNLQINPVAFTKALDAAKERYTRLKNSINSSYTKQALSNGAPQTGSGATVPLTDNKSEQDSMNEFVGQLKALNR